MNTSSSHIQNLAFSHVHCGGLNTQRLETVHKSVLSSFRPQRPILSKKCIWDNSIGPNQTTHANSVGPIREL